MRFVETPVFTRAVLNLLSDDQYRSLQLALMLRPDAGDLIPGSGDFESFGGACQEKETAEEQGSSITGSEAAMSSICFSSTPKAAKTTSRRSN
jgi:hypothetical protein